MRLSQVVCKKFNRLRKQNWSAPTTMSIFIVICMIVIFSLESIGLLNKEKNLDLRFATPETYVRINTEKINLKANANLINKSLKNEDLHINTKESFNELMFDILLNAANEQRQYDGSIAGEFYDV